MAISFDAQAVSSYSGGTSVTWSHTCTGSDRVLIVGAYCGTSAAFTATYNGVSMTAINSLAMSGAAAGQYLRLWYLINPATGANNCVLSSTSDMYGFSTSYTGASQVTQPDSTNTGGNASGSTSLTVSTTTTVDNDWLVGICYAGTAISAGTNTTLRSAISNILYMVDSNSAQTPAGSKSMNITHSSSFDGMIVAGIQPVASGGSTFSPRLSLLGVGR